MSLLKVDLIRIEAGRLQESNSVEMKIPQGGKNTGLSPAAIIGFAMGFRFRKRNFAQMETPALIHEETLAFSANIGRGFHVFYFALI
jgi:hypothetical protein